MTRLAIAIILTLVALGALIVLAGRTDWYDMSYRMASDAITTIEAFTPDDADPASAAVQTLSDPATWSPDFMRGAAASSDCPTDTLGNVRTRMAAIGPYELEEFERTVAYYSSTGDEPGDIPVYNRVSDRVRGSIAAADRIYAFGSRSRAADGSERSFSGYFVARGECIVHVQVTNDDDPA